MLQLLCFSCSFFLMVMAAARQSSRKSTRAWRSPSGLGTMPNDSATALLRRRSHLQLVPVLLILATALHSDTA